MYRESANPPEKSKGPTIGERFGKWWENLKERWSVDRIFASILFFLSVSTVSFIVSLTLARHAGENIYWESIPAKVAYYTSVVSAIALIPVLVVGTIWLLKLMVNLFLVMIGKKEFRELI